MGKSVLRLLIALILAGMVLSGCRGGENSLASTVKRESPANTSHEQQDHPDMNEASFTVEMNIPPGIKVNEPFVVEGLLCNNSDRAVEIMHGAAMFTYKVYHSDGIEVPIEHGTYTVNDIGIGTLLEPGSKYSYDGGGHISTKLNEIVLEQPGNYSIVAQAEFSIRGSEEGSKVIESEPYEIELK